MTNDDYTALPAWYVLELLSPRLRQIQAQHACDLATAATIMARWQPGDDEALKTASHLNYVVLGKVKLVGLRVAERLLNLAGLQLSDADEDHFVPYYGIRPAIRMAGDELYAARRPLTEDALVQRARELIARRENLLRKPSR